jgi:CspA family cold shock protein
MNNKVMGSVKWFNDEKGFGLITPDSGDDLYVDFTAIKKGSFNVLREGRRVSFVVTKGEKGMQAEEVEVI